MRFRRGKAATRHVVRSMAFAAGATALAAAGGTWVTPPAGAAAPTLSTTQLSLPANADPTSLHFLGAVSCDPVTFCVADGRYVDTTGNSDSLIETLSGGTWTPLEAPVPPGAEAGGFSVLGTVACPAARTCVATGFYFDAQGNAQPFADSLVNGMWTTRNLPEPANAGGIALDNGLSCPTATFCATAGIYQDNQGSFVPFAETLSGGHWTATETPLPANSAPFPATDAFMESISCQSAAFCLGTGFYSDLDGNTDGFVDTFAHGSWTSAEEPVPADSAASPYGGGVENFFGATCATAVSCVGVGNYVDTNGDTEPLLVTLTGGVWQIVTLPTPTDIAGPAGLGDAACSTATSCVVGGHYPDTAGGEAPLLETLSNGRWKASVPSLPADAAGEQGASQNANLGQVSCIGASGACLAIGSYVDVSGNQDSFLATLIGGSWTSEEVTQPANGAASGSESISIGPYFCATTTSCVVVGSYIDKSGNGDLMAAEFGGVGGAGSR